jgi:hypothetical protein
MQYEIKNLTDPGIIMIKISGETSVLDLTNLLLNAAKLLMGNKSDKIFIDITEEKGKFNLMDTYELVQKYPQYLRRYKFAILDRKENEHKIKMHETMALRRGFRMFGFTDKDEAIEWLVSEVYNEISEPTF